MMFRYDQTDDAALAIIAKHLQGEALLTFALEASCAGDRRALRALSDSVRLQEIGVVCPPGPLSAEFPSLHDATASTRGIDEALISAAAAGDLEKVSASLADGANLHAKGHSGLSTATAFVHAAFARHVNVTVALYMAGADPNERNNWGVSLIEMIQRTSSMGDEMALAAAAMGIGGSAADVGLHQTKRVFKLCMLKPLKAAVALNHSSLVLHLLGRDDIPDAEIRRCAKSAASAGGSSVGVSALLRSWLAKKEAAAVLTELEEANPDPAINRHKGAQP